MPSAGATVCLIFCRSAPCARQWRGRAQGALLQGHANCGSRAAQAAMLDAEASPGTCENGGLPAAVPAHGLVDPPRRSEEHTSELQSLMRISYAVFCLKKKKKQVIIQTNKIMRINTNTNP